MGGIISNKFEDLASKQTVNTVTPDIIESWSLIREYGSEKIAMEVFKTLYDRDPEIFSLFKSFCNDPKWSSSRGFRIHSKTVMNVLGSALVNIQTEEEVISAMATVGTLHTTFSIGSRHFELLKNELILQLEQHLKEKFTPEVKAAWILAYNRVAKGMQFAMQANTSGKSSGTASSSGEF